MLDENADICREICHILKHARYALFSASTGARALEIARKTRPHVATIDASLPDMEGLALLAGLRKLVPSMHCIVVSGLSDPAVINAAINLGAFYYLKKPFTPKELLRIVREAARTAEEG